MSKENPLWGAPRIHGELLKLGFEIAESTVSKYMIRRRGPPSQTWRTFLRNHAEAIADQRGHGARHVVHGHHQFRDGPVTIEGRTNSIHKLGIPAGWYSAYSMMKSPVGRYLFSRFM